MDPHSVVAERIKYPGKTLQYLCPFLICWKKKDCWNILTDERGNLLGNVILVDDLNVILNQVEKRGGSLVRDPIREKVDELI